MPFNKRHLIPRESADLELRRHLIKDIFSLMYLKKDLMYLNL